jgi:hypothetical protein
MHVLGRHSPLGRYREVTSGLTYARSLDRLLDEVRVLGAFKEPLNQCICINFIFQAENNFNSLQTKLESIRRILLKREKDSLLINLTGDNKTLAEANSQLSSFLCKLANSASAAEESQVEGPPFLLNWSEPSGSENEGFIIPSQASYLDAAAKSSFELFQYR